MEDRYASYLANHVPELSLYGICIFFIPSPRQLHIDDRCRSRYNHLRYHQPQSIHRHDRQCIHP